MVLCYQNTGKRSKKPLFLSLAGYIFSLVIYLICYCKENGELREQLNEIIKKTKSLNEIHKTKGDIVIQAKSNKDFSKINFEADNTDLNIKNQEVIFKVQIISSNARLAKNSPKFKDLKDIWEYKDSGLYKYNEFCKLDLSSSQKR